LTISGGYRFLPNLAGEAGLTLIGNATVNPPSAPAVNVSQTLLSVVGVGTVPLNSQISLFGKAGIGVHNGDVNGLPDDLIFGFGGRVLLSEKLSVRLQYESLGRAKIPSTSTRADLTRLSVGATYDF
jgi:opacity protein-like surface antigen